MHYVPITSLLKKIIDNRGKTVPTVETGFPLIATNCIKHSSMYPTFERVRYVDENTLKSWFRAHLLPNDILFVNKGTPGRVCLVPDPVSFCVAQDMIGFRCDEELINFKYLFAVLRSSEIQKKIENYHVGLVIPHFKKQDLSNLLIPLRTKKEQEIIGNLYFTLSSKIDLNNRINAELEAMAKTLYDYWFVQFDFPDAEGKPYKASGGKMVWNEELKREIPEGWEVGPIMSIAKLLGGGTPKTGKESYWNGTIPFFTPRDYQDSFFVTETNLHLTDEGLQNCSSKLYPKGTIFITARGTVGNINIASQDMAMNQSCYAIAPSDEVNYYFLHQCCTDLVQYIKAKANGSVFDAIVSNDFKATPIVIPPGNLIKKIGQRLESIYEKILIGRKENQKLAELRDWLLPMLMNGQVKVKDAEEEVALAMAAEESGAYR